MRARKSSRYSSRQPFLRDLPRAYVVLCYVACAASIALSVFAQRANPVTFALNEFGKAFSSAPKQADNPAKPALNEFNIDKRYAGSIIAEARRRDMCREIVFDNRTGAAWERGYVRCDVAMAAQVSGPKGLSEIRTRSVAKSFRHETD